MKSIAHWVIVVASWFSLVGVGFGDDLRVELRGEKQAPRIYNAVPATVVVNRLPAPKNDSGFTQFTSIEVSGASFTGATGINNSGQIVGLFEHETGGRLHAHGFLLDHGEFTTVDVPGASGTYISGINDRGVIIGNYVDGEGVTRAFVLRQDEVVTVEFPGSLSTALFGINDQEQLVGTYQRNDDTLHGFLLDRGVFKTIDVPGAIETSAQGINNLGQIVGYWVDPQFLAHGFLLDGDVFTMIDIPESSVTIVYGINSHAQMTGRVVIGAEYCGFVDDRGARLVFSFPSADFTGAESINNRRQIVGYYERWSGGFEMHGFLLE